MKVDLKTVVRKSVEMARSPMQLVELNRGLNLRQQRFFNMALLCVNDDGISEFSKRDYDVIFKENNDNFYGVEVRKDVQSLGSLGMQESSDDAEIWRSVFIEVKYDKNLSIYRFMWSPLMMEHVKNIQRTYIQQDLQILAHFKNKYSYVLYDFFKSNYRQWKWHVSKDQLVDLLRLHGKNSYLRNHSMFYKQCIENPLDEINEFTEYNITCEVVKKGRIVVGYKFERHQTEEIEYAVTENQINILQEIVDRYGDTAMLAREVSNFAVVDADAVPFLMELLFEMQSYKRFIEHAASFTFESFSEVVALAIKKDNTFKAKMRELAQKKADRPTIDDFLPQEPVLKKKALFYNWLDERE